MSKFSYVVKQQNGKTYKDVADAPSEEELIKRLQKQEFLICSIKEIKVTAPNRSAVKKKKKKKEFTHKKIKLQDILIFSHQLSAMLEAGVSLIRSLDVIQTQIKSQRFSETILKVKKDVERGESFSVALSKHPHVFNQFWVSLMEVGEASGTIPVVLHKLTFYLEQQAKFKTIIISGLIYPLILFGVSMGAVIFFALFVGPRFESIFKSMGAELPLITVILLSVFKVIKTQFFLIVLSIAAIVFAFKKYVQTYQGKLLYENFLFTLPAFGEIYKLIIIERFSSQMAILIDAGVPIVYALDITERLVNNNTCALVVNDIKECVKEGEFLVAPMERSEFFPSMCLQMIMVGEETGELSTMLKHVSKFYQDVVEEFMKRFATIIEPFMLVFMGAVIGTIVLAMFLPMFNMSQLGGGGGG